MVYDRETRESKGYCFVEFDDEASVKAAIATLQDLELHGRRLRISPAEEGPGKSGRGGHGGDDDSGKRRRRWGQDDSDDEGWGSRLFVDVHIDELSMPKRPQVTPYK